MSEEFEPKSMISLDTARVNFTDELFSQLFSGDQDSGDPDALITPQGITNILMGYELYLYKNGLLNITHNVAAQEE